MNRRKEIQEILTNWQYLVSGLQYEPEDFYVALEKRIYAKDIQGVSVRRVTLSQAGSFSRKREYLRVIYGDLVFDICAAPFGTQDFFFSYWMGLKPLHGCFGFLLPILLSIPFLGALIAKSVSPMTYYQRDTATMFNTLISNIVMEEFDTVIGNKGIEPIPEADRVPNNKKLTDI